MKYSLLSIVIAAHHVASATASGAQTNKQSMKQNTDPEMPVVTDEVIEMLKGLVEEAKRESEDINQPTSPNRELDQVPKPRPTEPAHVNSMLCNKMMESGCFHGGDMHNKEENGVFPACWIPNADQKTWSCYHPQVGGHCFSTQIDIRTQCDVHVYSDFFRFNEMNYAGLDFHGGRSFIPAPKDQATSRGAVFKL